MDYKEEQLSRTVIYEGTVFRVYQDAVLLPNQKPSIREVVDHAGGVCIAARKGNGEFLLVRQYRYALKRMFTEFAAGKKEKGEDPLICAQRELIEETGYRADRFLFLGDFVPTCGYDNEIIHLYYADALTFVGQHLDENEFLEVMSMPLDEIVKKVMNNEIQDGKTVALALKLAQLQEQAKE